VRRTASAEEIKRAYYKLIRIYHPDNNSGEHNNVEKFQEIVEAYKTLGNLENRLYYSIMLNKDLLDEKLLHKRFDIPEMDKKKKKPQKPEEKPERLKVIK